MKFSLEKNCVHWRLHWHTKKENKNRRRTVCTLDLVRPKNKNTYTSWCWPRVHIENQLHTEILGRKSRRFANFYCEVRPIPVWVQTPSHTPHTHTHTFVYIFGLLQIEKREEEEEDLSQCAEFHVTGVVNAGNPLNFYRFSFLFIIYFLHSYVVTIDWRTINS